MRSWLSLVPALLAAGSCGDSGADPACAPDDAVTWTSFGEPFVRSWCTGCHSSALGPDDRQGAPVGVDFDTLLGVREHADRVHIRAVTERDMPPAGGPNDADLDRLDRWLACGAPGDDDAPIVPTPTDDTAAPLACGRVGRWVVAGASCGATDITDAWLAVFPLTELVITEQDGACAIEYHVADAGCDERQAWRSDLRTPSATIEFLGTVSCEPVACAWDGLPEDVCVVFADPVVQEVPVTDLDGGWFALGPLSPPDLAPLCPNVGLVFAEVP